MIIQAWLFLSKPLVCADCWYTIIACFMCDKALVYLFQTYKVPITTDIHCFSCFKAFEYTMSHNHSV